MGTPAPDFPVFRPIPPHQARSHLGLGPIERRNATIAVAGKSAPDLLRAAPRAKVIRLTEHSIAGGICSRSATASSLHRAQRGYKASQEGCQRVSQPLPSRCRICRTKRFLRPRRRSFATHALGEPILVAVRRPPSRIKSPEAASGLGGGAGFREAKRGGVCAYTNSFGDAQAFHRLVQGLDFPVLSSGLRLFRSL